jgi:hypothetical protein
MIDGLGTDGSLDTLGKRPVVSTSIMRNLLRRLDKEYMVNGFDFDLIL